MAAAGVAARLVLAFAWYGDPFDQRSFGIVRAALGADVLGVYADVGEFRWPYPPAYFVWMLAADGVADLTGLAFHGLVSVPAIAADAGIAWLVQGYLGSRGADERTRLAAAALVLLGPSFAAISGYHGHIDSVAILPAVAALALWERGGRRRAATAGALIGIGIAVKTVPGLMLLALLPSARSRSEALTLLAAAAALPLLLLAPYLVTDASAVVQALDYPSTGTAGGIGLISDAAPNAITDAIRDHGTLWNLSWIAALAALLWRTRPPAPHAAVMVWLALWVLGTGFYLSYLVWGLPFVLMAGHLGATAAIQAIALVPTVITYADLFGTTLAARAFDLPMFFLWLCFGVALLLTVAALPWRPPRPADTGAP